MQQEYDSLIQNQTWKTVPRNESNKALDGKWIYRVKENSGGTIESFKACYVVCGFEQIENLNYFETCAPTLQRSSLRLLIAIVSKYNLLAEQIDISTSFLN